MLRSVSRWIGLSCVITSLAACTFESTGTGSSDDSLFADDGTETASTDDGDSDGADTDLGEDGDDSGFADDNGEGSGDGHGDTDGSDDQQGDTDDGGTNTEGDDDCSTYVTTVLPVEAARVVSPMEKVESAMGEGIYGRSLVADQGIVEFRFELTCRDEFTIWGRVNDFYPGSYFADPDSYFVRVDDGTFHTWFYGCQTGGSNQQWNWLPVVAGTENSSCSEGTRMTMLLGPGEHTVRFRNREGLNTFGEFAAVARILITNDPNFVPRAGD